MLKRSGEFDSHQTLRSCGSSAEERKGLNEVKRIAGSDLNCGGKSPTKQESSLSFLSFSIERIEGTKTKGNKRRSLRSDDPETNR